MLSAKHVLYVRDNIHKKKSLVFGDFQIRDGVVEIVLSTKGAAVATVVIAAAAAAAVVLVVVLWICFEALR